MFIHIFKYRLRKIIKSKTELLWSLVFPLILGSCFFVAFGNMTSKDESFNSIPVAVVIEKEDADVKAALEETSGTSDDDIINITYLDREQARDALANGEVNGIIYLNDSISLEIFENGIKESVLKCFLDRFTQTYQTITTVAAYDPTKIEIIQSQLEKTPDYNKNIALTDGNMDPMVQYFFALIAMTCLYGCFSGLTCSTEVKANMSALAARRAIAPVNRSILIAADFFATSFVQFINVTLLILYLQFILKINFGNQFGYILLTSLVGAVIGVAYGFFIGSLPKISEGTRQGLSIGSTMLACFLSGLMYGDMKIIIQHKWPILNKINPAALLTDAFYSLNVYTDHQRFYTNLALLLVFAFILCAASYLMTRRERYASL